jgi:hypothetical protein
LAEVVQSPGLQDRTDVKVVSPVQKKYLEKATEHALAAAHDAEKLKNPKYADACEAAGVDFRSFVLETFGGFVANVEEVVQSLATLMSHKTASSRADCIERI